MKKIIVLFICNLIFVTIKGQDLHFSQFFTQSMLLNAAQTGADPSDIRVAGVYRNQWSGIGSTFENMVLGVDLNREVGPGKLGVGALMTRDNWPGSVFNETGVMLSGAYHYYLDYPERHRISAGIQLGYRNKSFDASSLQFGNQYTDDTYSFDPNKISNENLNVENLNALNINAGVAYKFRINHRLKLNTGVHFNSIGTPNESFISAKNTNQLGVRYIGFLMFDYQLNEKLILSPKILYTNQSRGEDIVAGTLLTYKIFKESYAQAGGMYRIKDSGIIMLGYGWRSYLIRGSLDLTTSSLKTIKNIPDSGYRPARAYEIGFIYSGLFRKHDKNSLTVPCGIF